MRRYLIPLFALMYSADMSAQTIELELVKNGFIDPTDLAHCGDTRLFIVERAGRIKVLMPSLQLQPVPFLDISAEVLDAGGEQGLLGLAFHPQYALNGWFYVYYCGGSSPGYTRLSRFTVSADPNVADPLSEMVLWQLTQPYQNHNGGDLAFGPDGYLYFAPGDGGLSYDPGNRVQNMALDFGKMHRIDVDNGTPFGIPPDNPFANANNADTLRSIFASGFRNPFRFGFDEATGDIWIGDVGQGLKEEVDLISAGDFSGPNFGWRCREGTIPTPTIDQTDCTGNYVEPVLDHDHNDGPCAVIGGRVHRGTRYPALNGHYIYGDYCQSVIYSVRPDGGGGWIRDTLMTNGNQGMACIAEDVTNELYVVNTNAGSVKRIIETSAVVQLSVRVVLQGPFVEATGLMNDDLRVAGSIPLTEPYTTTLGFPKVAKGGSESIAASVLTTSGNNAMVDWVRVELRSAAFPEMIVATAQGVLQRDGDVVAVDNTSPLTLRVAPGNYHVVVRHRNHLACMTASAVPLDGGAAIVDFTLGTTLTNGTNARTLLGSTWALWSGNSRSDGVVKYVGTNNDRDAILLRIGGSTPTAVTSGYFPEDINLDGSVRYMGANNDRDPILVNVGASVPTAVVREQLP